MKKNEAFYGPGFALLLQPRRRPRMGSAVQNSTPGNRVLRYHPVHVALSPVTGVREVRMNLLVLLIILLLGVRRRWFLRRWAKSRGSLGGIILIILLILLLTGRL